MSQDQTFKSPKKRVEHVALVGTAAKATLNFRTDLIRSLVEDGEKVFLFCNDFTPETRKLTESLGATPVDNPLNRSEISPIADLKATKKLSDLFKKHGITTVFSFFAKPIVFGSLAAWIARVPCRVAMVEGMGWAFTRRPEPDTPKLRLIRQAQLMLYRIAFPTLHKVIFLNPDDLDRLHEQFMLSLPDPSVLGPIGVPEDQFNPTDMPDAPMVFTFIGRLLHDKGIREFIDAAKLVLDKYDDAEFHIYGDIDPGNPASLTAQQVGNYKKNKNIKFFGFKDDLTEAYQNSHVIVLPSYREGFPRVIQEAMAHGRPAIVTDVPGCRQSVTAGATGFVVPPFDADSLAQSMRLFLNAPETVEQFANQAYMHAEQNLDGKTCADKLKGLIIKRKKWGE